MISFFGFHLIFPVTRANKRVITGQTKCTEIFQNVIDRHYAGENIFECEIKNWFSLMVECLPISLNNKIKKKWKQISY